MYLPNKYTRTYYNIINRARERVVDDYTESHHIIPRSLGGNNSKQNLVDLTAREHFICHLLLVKMTTGNAHYKMIAAAWSLMGLRNRTRPGLKITSSVYERLKKIKSEQQSKFMKANNPMNDPLSRAKCSQPGEKNGMYNKPGTNKGKIGPLSHLYGKKRPRQSDLMKANNPGLEKTRASWICVHCNKDGKGLSNYARWHGDNCKVRPL